MMNDGDGDGELVSYDSLSRNTAMTKCVNFTTFVRKSSSLILKKKKSYACAYKMCFPVPSAASLPCMSFAQVNVTPGYKDHKIHPEAQAKVAKHKMYCSNMSTAIAGIKPSLFVFNCFLIHRYGLFDCSRPLR